MKEHHGRSIPIRAGKHKGSGQFQTIAHEVDGFFADWLVRATYFSRTASSSVET
jgi:hypothetical protein